MYGEAVEPGQVDLVRQAFPKAQVWTTYSSMEFALIAFMCPYEPEFHHLSAHRLGIEILGEDGSPVGIGERGRVVVTDYFNRRSPFIRYEIGDLAVPGKCPCGRIRMPALQRVDGKIRGALLHRDGRRVVFTDLSVALRDTAGMRQYQVIQDGLEDFTVNLVANRNLDVEVRAAIHNHFGYHPEHVTMHYVDEIPREHNGKFHASICRI
jgi:phenylacetate-CoA ligase